MQLDVTDDASVQDAARPVGALDVLVNNAVISGLRESARDLTADAARAIYETNVFGPIRLLHAFLPLLEASQAAVVVNVSSGLGSLGLASDPDGAYAAFDLPGYPSSKSALDMLTTKYAAAFPAMRINAVDPGYTATDLNAHRGEQSVEEGAAAIVRYARVGLDGPTGGFFDKNGRVPW